MTLNVAANDSFVHVFSDHSNQIEVTENKELKLKIHRSADSEVTQLIDTLHQLHFIDSQESDLDNWVLTIPMEKIDLTESEIQEASQPDKDKTIELVKLVSHHIKYKAVADNAERIDALVFPLNEEEQIYQNIMEKYHEVDGELVSKADGSKTGMTNADVKEMILQGVETKKIPKFEELPISTPDEAKKIVSKYKEGRFLLARDKDDDKLVMITYKEGGKVKQMILPPGQKENTFVYTYFLFVKSDLTLDEIVQKFSGIEMHVRGKVRFWKNEKGEPTYIVKKLGGGTFSKVYQFINAKEGVIGVLKDARRLPDIPTDVMQYSVKNEYEILSKIHSGKKVWGIQEKPHTCAAIPIRTKKNKSKERYGYIGPRYDGDYLTDILKRGGNLEERLMDFHQLLYGLKLMVDFGYLHGDLKPENVFVKTGKGVRRLYIADMGGACHQDQKARNLTDLVAGGDVRTATFLYNARQDLAKSMELAKTGNRKALLENERKRDVFSMGCILYIALTGMMPFAEEGLAEKYVGFPEENKMIIKGVPIELKRFIERMLSLKVNYRPTPAEAYEQYLNYLRMNYPDVLKRIEEVMLQEGYV